jgi:hypothetical protein
MAEYVYIKLIKPWGNHQIGDVLRFDPAKAQTRIIKGEGVKVSKQRAVNDPPEPPKTVAPKVETADARPVVSQSNSPAAENAVVTPVIEKDVQKLGPVEIVTNKKSKRVKELKSI